MIYKPECCMPSIKIDDALCMHYICLVSFDVCVCVLLFNNYDIIINFIISFMTYTLTVLLACCLSFFRVMLPTFDLALYSLFVRSLFVGLPDARLSPWY